MKSEKMNLSSIKDKLPKVSYDLFRFWTKELKINDKIIIKSEQNLTEDLTASFVAAIKALRKKKSLDQKPIGWSFGFIIGFVGSNLGGHWYREYYIKNEEVYKTYAGLRAIEAYLKTDKIVEIKIDKLYEAFLYEHSNISNLTLNVDQLILDAKSLELRKESENGSMLTILNNLIMKQIKMVAQSENTVRLPIDDFFSFSEIYELIKDNEVKLGHKDD